jgi:hypothetical protein
MVDGELWDLTRPLEKSCKLLDTSDVELAEVVDGLIDGCAVV